jgi:hypothetical protein
MDYQAKPDAWGGKIELLELPIVSVLLYPGLTWLARYPHKFNYPWTITKRNAKQQYRLAKSLVDVIVTSNESSVLKLFCHRRFSLNKLLSFCLF